MAKFVDFLSDRPGRLGHFVKGVNEMAYIFLFIGAAWLASAMFIASKLAPAAHEDDLGLVILFSVFWPVAGVAFYCWHKAQPEHQP